MRIKALKLKDFRPFHKTEKIPTGRQDANGQEIFSENSIDIEIKFSDSNLTVFIGENGSGKTTILDALGILLTKLFISGKKDGQNTILDKEEAVILHGNNPIALEDDDIYLSKKEGWTQYDPGFTSLELVFEYENQTYKWTLKGNRDENLIFKEELAIELMRDEKELGYDSVDNLVAKLKEQVQSKFFNLPIIAYYQTNRVVLDKLEFKNSQIEFKNAPQLLSLENAFTKNLFDFQHFADWFKLREDNEMEIRLGDGGLQYKDSQLEVVRTALYDFSTELNYPFSNLKVVRQVNNKRLYGSGSYSLVFDKNHNHEIKVKKLSAGEKSILVLVADIAHRIAIANPGLLNRVDSIVEENRNLSDDLLDKDRNKAFQEFLQNATGIVIIDEIDLHLHPKWQRLVVPALMATFPNVQFIVTTHSPLVLSKIKGSSIIKLKEFSNLSPDQSISPEFKDTNSILSDYMDTSELPQEAMIWFKEIFRLMEEGKVSEAKGKIQELEEIYGKEYSELVRAKTLLAFYED